MCLSGCEPIAYQRDERAGWEVALRGSLSFAYEAMWRDPWGVARMHEPEWDSYSSPVSRLQLRWGTHELTRDPRTGEQRWYADGNEVASQEGKKLAVQHLDHVRRIAEMSDAIRAFGAAVKADDGLRMRAETRREAVSWLPCLAAATAKEQGVGNDTDAMAERAIAGVWADPVMRNAMVREVGVAACIELHRCIVMRGGSFANIGDMLRQMAGYRDTPFGGYKHALAFANGEHGSTLLGWGSPLAGLGGAEATHTLRGGMRIGEIAVKPSHASTGAARNATTWMMVQDVEACMLAARVGGTWKPPAEGAPGNAATCEGGRPIQPWESELLRLCDLGDEVTRRKGDAPEWRQLTVVEAVDRVRQEAAKRRDDPRWGPARHLTTKQGRDALRAARRAVQDALAAWELVPPRERHEREGIVRQRPRRDDEPPRDHAPVAPNERAVNTWDPEAPR